MPPINHCAVSLTPWGMPADLSNTAVIVIDVLRATTTMACALQNGAHSIVPCEEPADARAVRERLGAERVLLGGERESVRIPGFDLDNSPLSCTREKVAGKILAFTTTNGTRALRRAMNGKASTVLCAAFVNLDAVVARVLQLRPANLLLACAGDEGAIALEDVLLAGAVIERLTVNGAVDECDDAGKTATLAYGAAAARLHDAIASSKHARALARAGFAKDIAFAARLNVASVVPQLRGDAVTA